VNDFNKMITHYFGVCMKGKKQTFSLSLQYLFMTSIALGLLTIATSCGGNRGGDNVYDSDENGTVINNQDSDNTPDDSTGNNDENMNDSSGTTCDISGYVQKGPFLSGSSVTIYELDSNLNQTGKFFQTQTIDNFGSFALPKKVISAYVEIISNGLYFNEVNAKVSSTGLTLSSISDATIGGDICVNVLTSLTGKRIQYLVQSEKKSFKEALTQAEGEVLDLFKINEAEIPGFDLMDISKEGDSNAILLAASVILQGSNSAMALSGLVSSISQDIEKDGILDNPIWENEIRNNSMALPLKSIRTNLEVRYASLGRTVTIPDFESYVDKGGDGMLKELIDEAIAKYKEEGYDYTRYLQQFEPFENFCNWSNLTSFHESEQMTFDEAGFPMKKYGEKFYYNPVTMGIYALHIHGKYLKGEASLEKFLLAADKLIALQDNDGSFRYSFRSWYHATGQYLEPGWVSGLAQGHALSVFARAYKLTGNIKYLNAGISALNFLQLPVSDGGVSSTLKDLDPSLADYLSFEEYPAQPATYTLNGSMFILLGLYSWWQIEPDDMSGSHKEAKNNFLSGIKTLEKTLPYYDIGGFSIYDLSFINYNVRPNISASYHMVHIYLLHALYSITGDTVLKNYEDLWASYVEG
jgi:heparosan-N-sulfate-glucuronate 5-epimerase